MLVEPPRGFLRDSVREYCVVYQDSYGPSHPLACMVERRTNQFDTRAKSLKHSYSLSACHLSLIIAMRRPLARCSSWRRCALNEPSKRR